MSRILTTLDFPPEKGGIQRYLFDIVTHTYGPCDWVLTNGAGADDGLAGKIPCKMKRCFTPFSVFNKKWSLVPICIELFLLLLFKPKKFTVESGNIYAALAPFILSFVLPVRYNIYCYGEELSFLKRKYSPKSILLRNVFRKADRRIFISEYTRKILTEANIGGAMLFFPPKIDIPGLSGMIGRVFKSPGSDTEINLLSVGRLVHNKGHEVLIKAAQRLPERFKWRLTIVGEGPIREDLINLISTLHIEKKVELKSGLNDEQLSNEYLSADIFILPTIEFEGFGIVLLEAMSKKIPIIASRCGGIPEVLDNGKCGVLVQPGNDEELADAVVSLGDDPERRKLLVANAYQRLISNYVWK